ncbi:hypothetical protein LZ518_08875 [Sphingomonas sp. RB56-2]|uniref:Uncharacterized protein n=1 Tax=Sphingomonas brevis TaxID=2908206 RepID=A0ABT0SA07_9SPHN|nr:hypothetical protein [Sphingomonas brevis]MCL6741241.1 hypothetical protein [Sphingomonas brevis]
MSRTALILAISVACAAWGKAQSDNTAEPSPIAEANKVEPAPVDPETIRPGEPGGLPDDRTPLEEPKGPIDPKSAEGAGQVMQMFGGLLEQRKFAEAYRLWSDNGRASGLTQAQFVAAYDKYAEIHSEVGKPGNSEGAAGSIYIDVPFRLYGKTTSGAPFNLVGTMTLRRVNDVPGSTEEQRRWHIARSDLDARP